MGIGKLIPRSLHDPIFRLLSVREFWSDWRRYARTALFGDALTSSKLIAGNLEAQVTKDYHAIEKGLALKEPKRPFGDGVSDRLREMLPRVPADADYKVHAQTAYEAHQDWNAGSERSDAISPVREIGPRGVGDPASFFASRHSVRDFGDDPVPTALLDHAVELAIHTPSVCNRQAWNVRFYTGADATDLRAFQNGNRGFGEIPVIALITVDARLFTGVGERNQPWIEGGLFSMTFVWALHALGLDTCMLNMSVTNAQASRVRARFDLDDAELIIMMIAIGYGREGHRRARSPRRKVSDVKRPS